MGILVDNLKDLKTPRHEITNAAAWVNRLRAESPGMTDAAAWMVSEFNILRIRAEQTNDKATEIHLLSVMGEFAKQSGLKDALVQLFRQVQQ